MEGKKGLAEGALHKEDFLTPQMKEHEVGLQVFRSLEKRNEEDKRQLHRRGTTEGLVNDLGSLK
jgi:hypothetical protein